MFVDKLRLVYYASNDDRLPLLRWKARKIVILNLNFLVRTCKNLELALKSKMRELYRGLLSVSPTSRRIFEGLLRSFGALPKEPARFYIPQDVSRLSFLRGLNSNGVNYVVLRWGNDIEDLGHDEDLDILVEDNDWKSLLSLVSKKKGGFPLDLYRDRGARHKGVLIEYFPRTIAKHILQNRVVSQRGFYVPEKGTYLLALAYHLIFHKKQLVDGKMPLSKDADRILREFRRCDEDFLNFSKTYDSVSEGLIDKLHDQGFLPPLETISNFCRENPIFTESFRNVLGNKTLPELHENLVVFILRSYALENGLEEKALTWLEDHGFSVVDTFSLSSDQVEEISALSRGGNWGKGPYFRSGGLPAKVVTCFDSFPDYRIEPGKVFTAENFRYRLKNKLRKDLLAERLFHTHANFIHSPDNTHEAMQILGCLTSCERINQKASDLALRMKFSQSGKLVSLPSRPGRSRSYKLIKHDGSQLFLKVFALGQEKFFEREVDFYTSLGQASSYVLNLVEVGHNWFTLPWVDDGSFYLSKREKKRVLKNLLPQVLDFLHQTSAAGFYLADFAPKNLILRDDKSPIFVDFEHAQKIGFKQTLFESWEIGGLPLNAEVEMPKGWVRGLETWDYRWKPSLGVSANKAIEEAKNLGFVELAK